MDDFPSAGAMGGGVGATYPIDMTSPRWLAWIPGIVIIFACGCIWIGAWCGCGVASGSEPTREMAGEDFRDAVSPVDSRREEDAELDEGEVTTLSGRNDGLSPEGVTPADGVGLLTTRCCPRDPSGIITGDDDLLRSAASSVFEFEFEGECLSLPFRSATAARTSA
jgi:hypothetical protein